MKICIIGQTIEALHDNVIGGAEKQVALLAHHLARRGHQVTFVIAKYGNFIENPVPGVEIISNWLPDRGVRGLRFFYYFLPSLGRLLRKIDADVYYIRGASLMAPCIVLAAQQKRAISVIALASDRNLRAAEEALLYFNRKAGLYRWIGRLLYSFVYYFGIRAANWVIVQNEFQQASCNERGISCRLIPSIVDSPPTYLEKVKGEFDVIWVGNVGIGSRHKGVEELLLLAKKLPEVRFEIVGDIGVEKIKNYRDLLMQISNVHLMGALPHHQVLEAIARSKLVINTSPFEGVSNVMLEGWSLAKPAVSLNVNPSGLLNPDGLGHCASGNIDNMVGSIRWLLIDETERHSIGLRCRRYIMDFHSPDRVCQLFETLICVRKNTSGIITSGV